MLDAFDVLYNQLMCTLIPELVDVQFKSQPIFREGLSGRQLGLVETDTIDSLF